MIKLQAHRGVCAECPENTMPAFITAIEQGYDAIETDVMATKDNKLVLHHDRTINRTARRADGSDVGASLPLSYLTYDELLEYDFGIGYHKKYKGTKLPLLEDLLALAKKHGVEVKIDAKYRTLNPEAKEALFALVRSYEDVIAFTVNDLESLAEIRELFPNIHVHYGRVYSVDTITEAAKLAPADKITFWLPYNNKRTSYVKVPFINEELATAAKQHGTLAVWNLTNYAELEVAKKFGADIVETNGQIKHEQNVGILSDMHTHNKNSHDAFYEIRPMVEKAIERNIRYMAVTDHCDIFLCEDDRTLDMCSHIATAAKESNELNKELGDKCLALRGVELGDGIWFPDICQKVIDLLDYDVIIGAVHAVKCAASDDKVGMKRAYSQIKYDEATPEQLDELLDNYCDDLLTMVETLDIDIMAHLICPTGYPLNRHGIFVDMLPYKAKIEKVLRAIIRKGIAFEANGSLFREIDGKKPNLFVIEMFRDLGGHLITISTDAHSPAEVGKNLAERTQLLRELGFRNIFYFKDRKAIPCTIA